MDDPMANWPNEDLRLKATRTVWLGAIGMLGVCIPLVGILGGNGGPLLPLAVIVGATVVTARIWKATGDQEAAAGSSPAALSPGKAPLSLEDRLANLETIVTREDWQLKERIERLEKKQ
jgi:hypothetical protein